LKFPGRKASAQHTLGVSQITYPSTDAHAHLYITGYRQRRCDRLPCPPPAKPPASAGGFGYSVIETLLVAGDRLARYR
jgi:hypothetical protein